MRSIISTILLVALSFTVNAQKKADLAYNLELNKVYLIKSTSVQNTSQTMQGNSQLMQTENIGVISVKPLKQLEGEIIAEIKFDTIQTMISQPPMDISSTRAGDMYSSDPAKIMESILHRMANSTFLAKMTNTGQVVEFMNLEPTVAGILKGLDSIQGQAAAFIQQRAETMVEEKALKSMIETATAYLPGSEVKVGEKWDINMKMYGGGMGFSQAVTYKLESIEDKTAQISGDIILESEPGTMDMNGATITPDIRGIGKVKLTIDTETGWIIKGEIKQQLKGELLVNVQGNSMTIPTEINSTTELVAIP